MSRKIEGAYQTQEAFLESEKQAREKRKEAKIALRTIGGIPSGAMAGFAAGVLFDYVFQTSPWGTSLGAVAGGAGGGYLLNKRWKKDPKMNAWIDAA